MSNNANIDHESIEVNAQWYELDFPRAASWSTDEDVLSYVCGRLGIVVELPNERHDALQAIRRGRKTARN